MKKIFLFKGARAESVKVSHNFVVGLPSLTGLTGLASAFAAKLAQSQGLNATEFVNSGVLFGFEDYVLHEGYKKGYKTGKAVYEAIPSAWASFTAHFAFEVEGTTERARQLLASEDLAQAAQALLASLSFCKGRLQNVGKPVNLAAPRLVALGNERTRALAMFPSFSTVLVGAGFIVEDLRAAGLPLMEGLVAATLPHHRRPLDYKTFYEQFDDGQWKLAPVQDGYLIVDPEGASQSLRPTYSGVWGKSHVASPTLSLVRLQTAASLRLSLSHADNLAPVPFWSLYDATLDASACKGYYAVTL